MAEIASYARAMTNMSLTPIERLRARVLAGKARLAIIGGALFIWVMDAVVSRFLIARGAYTGGNLSRVEQVEWVGTAIFLVVLIALVIAVIRGATRSMLWIAAIYLAFSVIQVMISVAAMVSSVTMRSEVGLTSLWDVGVMYLFSVTVFTFVYVLMDLITPKGAFVWPARDDEPAPTPNLFDYMFISLNVNSTYGPTSEAVMSRPTKMLMSLQVILAILMLTVLIARAVSATS